MIRSFRNKGLRQFWNEGDSRRLSVRRDRRVRQILMALHAATQPDDLNLPGLRFHGLQGSPRRWSVAVTGNWRITWSWDDGAADVDLEDYH
ncbi:MAG: plasmid maintenance system killer protein [Rhodospirillales bacterium RIFCSPLOWO2_12_FULL_58_28]|nr:MAG: plasmid maintenance system killer protein [Rhodospirillales bacterium RIFCSPLOWO2_02_FULL_58_16]OHC77247.1 MAG: plasmid maintenance system killer protein [Rhodospirillales bacterium RIFCSPLOWO2_12_FULL_58_28]